MTLLTKKKEERIKSHVTNSLIKDYKLDEFTARFFVNKSAFAELLREDPENVCHYDARYWAKNIKEELRF